MQEQLAKRRSQMALFAVEMPAVGTVMVTARVMVAAFAMVMVLADDGFNDGAPDGAGADDCPGREQAQPVQMQAQP